MKSLLWFRRDLRINDNAILAHAKGEVLPIFIFDTNILNALPKEDKRVGFIYKSVCALQQNLQSIGLDLVVFYGKPEEIFKDLKNEGFDEVWCSVDYDAYAIERDKAVEKILHVRRVCDSFMVEPSTHLKADKNPYKVFTPFYKSLSFLWQSLRLEELCCASSLTLAPYPLTKMPSLEKMGFCEQDLPSFLHQEGKALLEAFKLKLPLYEKQRDYFAREASSQLSVHLRFGLLSPREVFNALREEKGSEFFIRELFWREFYAYILYHFPKSECENYNGYSVEWNESAKDFEKWCEGKTGFPIIDAAMRMLNETGLMHNRLRMVVASFLTKNLLIDWRWGEAYFASKLLDYEASSNIGSWQWAASTGADSVPYFRIFNPCTQSLKFDKEALFIKSKIPELQNIEPKNIHKEGGLDGVKGYVKPMISLQASRQRALEAFKKAKHERD